jgi:hypothetical protein
MDRQEWPDETSWSFIMRQFIHQSSTKENGIVALEILSILLLIMCIWIYCHPSGETVTINRKNKQQLINKYL